MKWTKKYRKEYMRRWRENHKEHDKKYRQTLKCQERKREYKKKHPKMFRYKDNRRYYNEYCKRYFKERRKADLGFRLDCNVRVAVSSSLKGKKGGKRWNALVGYALQDLIIHLEKQFDKNMSWENYGSYWHIDHIKPKSLFKYKNAKDPQFKECWALKNLQPMEKIANIKKSNKY